MKSLFFLLFLLLPTYTTADSESDEYVECYDDPSKYTVGNYTAGSTYARNLNNLLTSIVANSGSYNWSSGQPGPDRVNAIWRCRGDLSPNQCRQCMVKATSGILEECPNWKEAYGWFGTCMIRFSNWSIFGTPQTFPTYYFWNTGNNVSDPNSFTEALETLFTRIRVAASRSGDRFATGRQMRENLTPIYGYVQCTRDLSSDYCDRCLSEVVSQIPTCCAGIDGGGVINPSCNLRFDTYRFYAGTDAPPAPATPLPPDSSKGIGGAKNSSRIIAIVVPIVGASLLGGFGFFFFFRYRRRLKRSKIGNKGSSQNDMTGDDLSMSGSLQFDFDIIKAATNGFTDENKLGEGGFGAVYKGTLANGQEIAVKRLDKDSRQGDLEFKNEVKLVAELQHRNLVRLLGFCLEGRERLLIYEFVPNASLDRFLFNPDKHSHLDWERRYTIIGGIARGLVYLHEDSRLRIIHRNLKVSNILLDADMNPKIADFGLAKLFDIDETQNHTNRIVGTYGYMAPEYAYHGRFSVKSDVFSFGVLILEIISGQKINSFNRGTVTEDLLSYAWKNWNAGTYSNVVDPSLGNVSGPNIARCIHVGLLCVQENVNDRPTMTSVALMLTSNLMRLHRPLKPAFFMHTSTKEPWGQGSSRGYGSTSSVGVGSSTSTDARSLSKNDVSISDLYPR